MKSKGVCTGNFPFDSISSLRKLSVYYFHIFIFPYLHAPLEKCLQNKLWLHLWRFSHDDNSSSSSSPTCHARTQKVHIKYLLQIFFFCFEKQLRLLLTWMRSSIFKSKQSGEASRPKKRPSVVECLLKCFYFIFRCKFIQATTFVSISDHISEGTLHLTLYNFLEFNSFSSCTTELNR